MLNFFSGNEKVDYITIDKGVYLHKQIERRDGVIFMRMKKRILPPNEARP